MLLSLVANLQVRNLPDELHALLRQRAAEEGATLSEYVTRILRREATKPSLERFLEEWRALPTHADVDVAAALDVARAE